MISRIGLFGVYQSRIALSETRCRTMIGVRTVGPIRALQKGGAKKVELQYASKIWAGSIARVGLEQLRGRWGCLVWGETGESLGYPGLSLARQDNSLSKGIVETSRGRGSDVEAWIGSPREISRLICWSLSMCWDFDYVTKCNNIVYVLNYKNIVYVMGILETWVYYKHCICLRIWNITCIISFWEHCICDVNFLKTRILV